MSSGEATGSLRALAQQLWGLLDVAEKRQCAAVLLISIVAACLTLVGVAGFTPFFAVLADPAVATRNAQLAFLAQALAAESAKELLLWLGAASVALLFLANLANFLAILAIGHFAHRVGARFHSQLFEEYLHRDLEFHAGTNGAVLATRVVQEVNRTVGGVIYSLLMLCASAVSIALIAGAIIVVDPLVASAAALSLVLSYALIYALVRRRLVRNGTIITHHWHCRAQVIAESFASIKDVLVHRAQPEMAARVARHSAAIGAAQASTPAIAASPKYLLECVTGAGLVTAALWIYGAAGAGSWLTHLAFLGFAAYRLLPAGQQLFAALARIEAERAGFDGIAEDLRRARSRPHTAPSAVAAGEWHGRPRRSIRVVDVTYRYPEGAGAISGVSLEIPAGTLAGFVGPNGAGKSTLAELILGLLAPDSGHVEIDGVALHPGNRDAWLGAIAYVPQQIALLDATLAQNIAFGVPAHEIDRGRVHAAASRARLDRVIEELPHGLATVIGERGVQLSGGQRQRVGLARALYRRASLFVVDEGTNALDAPTEGEVMTVLDALRAECTVIVIAHRMSALAGCDALFELDGGRLVGRTTFAELAASAGPRERAHR